MKHFSSNVLYTLLYLGNQFLAVLSTILVIRFGKDAFTLSWSLGVILALGWGATMFGLLNPPMASRIWSASSLSGLRQCLRTLLMGLSLIILCGLIPISAHWLSSLAGISPLWVVLFVSTGLVRACTQLLSTFSIRMGRHAQTLRYQLPGRVFELIFVVWGCMTASPLLLVIAWLIYPLAQVMLVMTEWHHYHDFAVPTETKKDDKNTLIATVASQGFDLLMPTLWLKIGGESVFIAYRSVTAALANSALLPRYWYVVVAPAVHVNRSGAWAVVVVLLSTLVLSAAFQYGTGAVSHDFVLWSIIPILMNSLGIPAFSRMRQNCLNQGRLIPPSIAIIVGHLGVIMLLFLLVGNKALPVGALILAYTGFALCTPALRYYLRRPI